MKTRSTQRQKSAVARARQCAGRSDCRAWSGGIAALLEEARRQSARSVNAILTATYWEVGRRIVQFVQQGEPRAEYGDEVLKRLSGDLTKRFGRGFGPVNLNEMKRFFLAWPVETIFQTLSEKSWKNPGEMKLQTASVVFGQVPSRDISGKPSRKTEIEKTRRLLESPLRRMRHA